MDLTLVAYYGRKPGDFYEFVVKAQHRLTSRLGGAFVPHKPEQIHGTIIGLEGEREGTLILNTNYLKLRQHRRSMDLLQAVETIGPGSKLLPIEIRLGGYEAASVYPFASRGLHPFVRSFSMQGDVAVAMGWPVAGKRFSLSLGRLRRAFERANVLHKYHATDSEIDNDFFFVLGRIDRAGIKERHFSEAQQAMREFLAAQEPLQIELRREHLSLVAYTDPTLPLQDSRIFPLDDVRERLDEITSLYVEVAPEQPR